MKKPRDFLVVRSNCDKDNKRKGARRGEEWEGGVTLLWKGWSLGVDVKEPDEEVNYSVDFMSVQS